MGTDASRLFLFFPFPFLRDEMARQRERKKKKEFECSGYTYALEKRLDSWLAGVLAQYICRYGRIDVCIVYVVAYVHVYTKLAFEDSLPRGEI